MTIKYLKDDLNCLYEVLCTANKQIHSDYNINIVEGNTISSIAMKLYLNKHYKNNIPSIVKPSLYNDIKLSYFGGITEVYKPYGENLYYYDVNSLYPFAAINDMAGLSCEKVEFHKPCSIDGLFGFFNCSIESPSDLYLGCLPIRNKTGIMQPVGSWDGWYFSEELKFAKDNGYNITVNSGYIFSRESGVFDSYIGEIYKVKSNPSNNSQKVIAKSLLNNLLGRFGISLDKPKSVIVSSTEFSRLGLMSKIHSYRNLDNGMVLVTYSDRLDYDIIAQHDLDFIKVLDKYRDKEISVLSNCSIAVASAVTSYARIHMSKLKQYIFSKGGSLYYSDTDSVITDIELPAEMVSPNKIGLLKLEHIIKKGIFITGKTYCFIDDKGNYVNKIKGLRSDSLSYEDYDNLLHGNTVTSAIKNFSSKNWSVGDVKIGEMLNVTVNSNSYTKRVKVMNNGLWVNTTPNLINNKKYHTYAGKNYFTKSLIPYVSNKFLILYVVPGYSMICAINGMYLVIWKPQNTSLVIFCEFIIFHNIFTSKGLTLYECLYAIYLSTIFLIACLGYLSSYLLREDAIMDLDSSDITIPSEFSENNISYFESWLSLFNNNGEGQNYPKDKLYKHNFPEFPSNTTSSLKSSVILDQLDLNNTNKFSDSTTSEIKPSMVYVPQLNNDVLFSPFTPTTLTALEDELLKTDHKIKQMIGDIDQLSLVDKRRLSSLIDEKEYFISQHTKHVQSLLASTDLSIQNSENKLMNLDKLESEMASHRKDILEYKNKLINDNNPAGYDKNILETSNKTLSENPDNWKGKLSQEEIKHIDNMNEPLRSVIKSRIDQENSYR